MTMLNPDKNSDQLGQNFSGGKIFKILVVSNNINRKSRTFKIMLPYFKSIKNSQYFLVMNIIVELHCRKSPGMKSNRMNISIGFLNLQDSPQSII